MKNKYAKAAVRMIITIVATTTLLILFDIFSEGMYLIGIPQPEEVEKVKISYPEISDEIQEVTEKEQIDLAVHLSGFLRYSLFQKPDLSDPPLITVTYITSGGETVCVSANKNTVWWKGKAHSIKQDENFIKMTKAIFY